MYVAHYETARGDELIGALPLAKPYRYYTLYSLSLPHLTRGSVVHLHSQFEVTNDLGYNVMVAHALMFHPQETIVTNAKAFPDGRFVAPAYPAGENVTPRMHHGFRTLAGTLTVSEEMEGWASVVIYAASNQRNGPKLTVHARYGGLSAVVFREPA